MTSSRGRSVYALAKVALEGDFGARLIHRKGRIVQDVDLEF
jgi:hypothetical protein